MAKTDHINKRFVCDWHSGKTGWDYRFVLYPSADTAVDSPTDVIIPLDCISFDKFGYSYEMPWGMPEFPALSFEVNLAGCPQSFAEVLLDPYAYFDVTVDLNTLDANFQTGANANAEFWAGNYVQFWIKFNGQDDNSTVNYQLIYDGIQKWGDPITLKSNSLKVETLAMPRVIFESIKTSELNLLKWYLAPEAQILTPWLLDFAYLNADSSAAEIVCVRGAVFKAWMKRYSHINTLLTLYSSWLYGLFSRGVKSTFTVDLPEILMYKQTFSGTDGIGGVRGEQLDENNLLFPAFSTSNVLNPEPADAINNVGAIHLLSESFKTIIDFVNDLFEGHAAKMWYNPYPVANTPLVSKVFADYGFGGRYADYVLTYALGSKDLLDEPEFTLLGDTVQRVNCSLRDTTNQDADNIEFYNQSSRNDNSATLTPLFSNTPAAPDRVTSTASIYGITPDVSTNNFIMEYNSRDVHFLGLYYLATLTGIYSGPKYLRCHEHSLIKYSSSLTSDDIITVNPIERLTPSHSNTDLNSAYNINIQRLAGHASILANSSLKLLSKKNQITAEIKTDLNVMPNLDGSNNRCIWLNPQGVTITMNLAEYEAYSGQLTAYASTFFIQEVEIDLHDETVSAKLLGVNY